MWQQSVQYANSFIEFSGRRALVAAALAITAALLEGIGIVLIIPFLELFSAKSPSGVAATVDQAMKSLGLVSSHARLMAGLAIFLALLVVRNTVVWARDVRLMELSIGFVDRWRSRIFHGLVEAQWSTVATLRRTDIEHSITIDIMRLSLGTTQILTGVSALVVLVIQIAIAIMLSPILTGFVLVFIAIALLLLIPLMGKAKQLGVKLTESGRNMHSVLGQFLSGLKLAKAHNAELRYVEAFDQSLDVIRQQRVGFTREQAMARLVFQCLSGLMACVVVALGVFVFATPAPVLIVILFILARLTGPFQALQHSAHSFLNMLPAFESMNNLLASLAKQPSAPIPRQAQLPEGPASRQGVEPIIAFHDVHFRHVDQPQNVLNGVSLAINSGEIVALSGPSGVGKTTLVDIMTGILTPTSGTVTVSGRPLGGSVLEGWRSELAYVPQDPFLFDVSLRENLLWAKRDSSDAELWQTLKLTGADEFVRALKDGLDTRVGERGQSLSGGERQRICLARALLGHPRMLILDEATNAMDLQLEGQLLKALESQRQHMTILIITHRTSGIMNVDRVVELRDGRICENEPITKSGKNPDRSDLTDNAV